MFRLRFWFPLLVFAVLSVPCLPAVSVTIGSNPIGQVFTVDGIGCAAGGYSAPQTLSWTPVATLSLTVCSAQTVTANFSPIAPGVPGNYAVSQIASATPYAINNSGQVAGYSNSSATLWTPLTPNGIAGNVVDIGGLANTTS